MFVYKMRYYIYINICIYLVIYIYQMIHIHIIYVYMWIHSFRTFNAAQRYICKFVVCRRKRVRAWLAHYTRKPLADRDTARVNSLVLRDSFSLRTCSVFRAEKAFRDFAKEKKNAEKHTAISQQQQQQQHVYSTASNTGLRLARELTRKRMSW